MFSYTLHFIKMSYLLIGNSFYINISIKKLQNIEEQCSTHKYKNILHIAIKQQGIQQKNDQNHIANISVI